ncbi:MAG: uroporphyrinogen-III synthase [Paludibacteraceae bacterium]|nr:uroporphyrinogen-III synthase [Paludibacteraceae bacterium]
MAQTKYKILVSQPRPLTDHNRYADMEEEFGVTFDFRQLIRLDGLDVKEFRKQHINPLDYSAVLLNTRVAADQYFRLCTEMRVNVPDTMHFYCLSESIAGYLQRYIPYRKRKVFYAENNSFEELLPTMNRRPNEKYLMVVSENHSDDVINMLAAHKIVVKPAIMYRSVPAEWDKNEPFDYKMVVVFTSTGVTALHNSFPDLKTGDIAIAAFGQNTVAALRAYGLEPDVQAPTPEFPGITSAIRYYLENHREQ